MFYFIYFSDKNVIVLTELDIDDPHVHVDIENIRTYSMRRPQNWLLYRGDTLQSIANLKDTQVKVLQYFKQRIEQKLYDPTPNKKCQPEKAQIMGMNLKKKILWKDMPNMPKGFEYDLTNLHSVVSWSKSLDGLPQFSVEDIKKICKHGNCSSVIKVYGCKKAFQSWRAIDRVLKCWHWVDFHQAVRWFLLFQRWLWG